MKEIVVVKVIITITIVIILYSDLFLHIPLVFQLLSYVLFVCKYICKKEIKFLKKNFRKISFFFLKVFWAPVTLIGIVGPHTWTQTCHGPLPTYANSARAHNNTRQHAHKITVI